MKQNRHEGIPQTSITGSSLRLGAKFVRYLQSTNSFSMPQTYLTLSVSYLQVFFMTTRVLRDYTKNDSSSLRAALKYLEDIITFDNLFAYSQDGMGILLALLTILVYFMTIFWSFLILRKSVKSLQKPHFIVTAVWSFVVQFHNPIFFFMISHLCAHVQKNYADDKLNLFETTALNQVSMILSIIIFALNAAVTFGFDLLLCDSLPTKNPMSSKNSLTDRITIFQKLIISLLWRFLPTETFVNWLIMVLNLVISFVKHYFYYYTYPRYNTKVLKFNAYMLTIEASIVLMAPLVSLLNEINKVHISVTSTMMIIVLLIPFLIISVRGIVTRHLTHILQASPQQLNPYELVHRLALLGEIKLYKDQPGEDENHFNRNWLHFAGVSSHRKIIFNEEDEDLLNSDFIDTETQDHTIRNFLERANKQYPHNSLVMLTLIQFYVKPLGLLPLAMAHLAKIKSMSLSDKLSVDLLYLEIEEAIFAYYKQEGHLLDMQEYLLTMDQAESFETKIWTQLNLHRNFWIEYSKNIPDTSKLYKLSGKIKYQKKVINLEWNKCVLNREYSQPFLLYACYLFALDDSPQKGQKIMKTHNLLNNIKKDEENFQGLTTKNMYSEDTFYITITTDIESIGKIVKCSSSIRRSLGYDPKSVIGTNINQLMSTYIAHNHNHFILNYIKTGQAKFMNRIQSVFIKDKMGYLQKASMFAKVHPFFSQEIYLTAMIKPIEISEECILITPQGQIDSTTSGIARKLGIEGKKVSMVSICPDFEKIDKLYNYFGYKQLTEANQDINIRNVKEDEDARQKIYDKWSSEGDNLKFLTFSESFTCFCHIHNYYFASDFMKVIIIKNMDIHQQKLVHTPSKIRNQQISQIKDHQKSEAFEDENSFEFGEINEREKTNEILQTSPVDLNSPHRSNQGFLLAQDTPAGLQYTATQGSYREDQGLLNTLSSPKNQKKSCEKINKDTVTANSFRKVEIKLKVHEGSVGSGSQLVSRTTRTRLYNVIAESLSKKGYTKSEYIFLSLCLCLAVGLFASQLSLLQKVRTDLNTLEALGTTLDYANTGVDALIYLSRGARITFLGQNRIIDVVTSSNAAAYVKAFRNALSVYLPILEDSNSGLWSSLSKIEETFRNQVLAPNIQFFEFYPNLTVESLRPVNALTGAVLLENQLLRMQTYFQQHGTYDPMDLIYVMRNAVNGLPVENKNLAEAVLAYIKTSIENQHVSLNILFGAGLGIIFLGLLLVIIYSYQFYKLEVKRLSLFMRLCEQEVHSIQENLYHFEETLKSQEYDIAQHIYLSQAITPNKDPTKIYGIQNRNKQNYRLPNTKNLQKSYLLKILYWTLILGLYASFIVIVYSRVYQNGSNFESGINRLITVRSFLEHIQICILGVYSMFIPEYEPTLETVPTQELLEKSLAALVKAPTHLTAAYTLADGTLDPTIKPTFSGNICNLVPAADLPKCLLIAPGAQVKDLFTVMSALYTEISFGLQSYLESDKSYNSSQTICTRTFVNVSPIAITLRDVFLSMSSQARQNFNQIYTTLLDHLNIYLEVNIVLFWTLFVISWFSVVKYIMSYNNRMKRMMMVVPLRFLITNKSMRPLLMETCKDQTNAIRNEF